MRKIFALILIAVLTLTIFSGCSKSQTPGAYGQNTDTGTKTPASFDASHDISVVSREDGSGTRGAFIELFGVQEKAADGSTVDLTSEEASITNSTSVMMTSVAGDPYSIGYISLGSLNDTVKAVKIDGAEATVDNINNGSYKIVRPFNIATKAQISDLAKDFIDYIMSADGQKVIADNGYITVSDAAAYSGAKPSGKIVVAGSSSVTPVMEKLKEAYNAINPNADIEIQQSDSTTGMTSAIDGVCDIGMASRELKDSETQKGLSSTVIAKDGIAVIVNNGNSIDAMTSDQVKSIFTGDVTTWSEITG